MSRRKAKSGRLSVFKGREARLNKAIFHTLALKGPLTIYYIHKEVRTQRGFGQTRYANVNKRVRALEESQYIRKAGIKKTKAGFETCTYGLYMKAYLVMLLNSVNLDEILLRVDDSVAQTILATILEGYVIHH